MVLQQQAVSAQSAATKSQREIHVGNLVPGAVSEAILAQIFNTALSVRFPGSTTPGLEPVVRVQVHKDGRFGFVELRTAEMASAAMDLNGQVQFLGNAMSVNRPSAWLAPSRISAAFQSAGMPVMTGMGMAGLSMPGMGMGVGPMPMGMVGAPMGMGMPPGAGIGVPLPGPPPILPGVPPPMPPPGPPPPSAIGASPTPPPFAGTSTGQSPVPTPCICVLGMVGADVLTSDSEYAEVLQDLKGECEAKAGSNTVLQIKVPRPPQPEMSLQLMGVGNYGKAYVFFNSADSAARAQAGIHGRMFAGKTLHVVYVTADFYTSIPL
ncbi:hypothetical protein FOA52_005629 [Chlamydomonas sp. UWO 241]|nr:hypothetical protein FOA52_005629 [Chlamydomonas sp. UWO 241]